MPPVFKYIIAENKQTNKYIPVYTTVFSIVSPDSSHLYAIYDRLSKICCRKHPLFL